MIDSPASISTSTHHAEQANFAIPGCYTAISLRAFYSCSVRTFPTASIASYDARVLQLPGTVPLNSCVHTRRDHRGYRSCEVPGFQHRIPRYASIHTTPRRPEPQVPTVKCSQSCNLWNLCIHHQYRENGISCYVPTPFESWLAQITKTFERDIFKVSLHIAHSAIVKSSGLYSQDISPLWRACYISTRYLRVPLQTSLSSLISISTSHIPHGE